jgi:hypothetical protein
VVEKFERKRTGVIKDDETIDKIKFEIVEDNQIFSDVTMGVREISLFEFL